MLEMLNRLLGLRNELYAEAEAILGRADANGRLSAADAAEFDRVNDEIAEVDARGEELAARQKANQKFEENKAEFDRIINPAARKESHMKSPGFIRSSTRAMSDQETYLRSWMAGKEGGDVVEFDFADLDEDYAQRIIDGVRTPQASITKVSEGGDLVPTDFLGSIYRNLIERSSLLAAGATILTTNHGRSITVPKFTARGTGAIVGEGTAIAGTDPTFGSTTLDAWKAAQLITVSNEMLEDTEVDLEAALAFDLGRSLGEVVGPALITGNGTNTARGIMVATAADVGTAVQVASASVEVDNLIDLFYSVATPYRNRGQWLMRAGTMKAVHKLIGPDSAYVSPPLGGSPQTLMGRPVIIDPNVAAIGSGNLSIGFGDIGAYYVRFRNLLLARSTDHKFAEDMTSFRATLRFDGDLVDQTGAFKVLDTD